MTRGSYHHGNLANALLDAADDQMVEGGVAHLSLRQTAAAVGVAPSAAYHHFTDRDALIDALAVRALEGLAEVVARRVVAVPAADVDRRLQTLGRAYVTWARREPEHFSLAFGPQRADHHATSNRRPYELLDSLLDDAVDQGALPRAARQVASELMWPAIHGLAALAATGPLRARPERTVLATVDHMVLTILRGLRSLSS